MTLAPSRSVYLPGQSVARLRQGFGRAQVIAALPPTWPSPSRSHQRPGNLHTQQRDIFHGVANTIIYTITLITLIQCP